MLKVFKPKIQTILGYCVVLLFITLIVSCTSSIQKYDELKLNKLYEVDLGNNFNLLKIYTRIDQEDLYREYKTIEEKDIIVSIINILEKASWINGNISIVPPLYKLEFISGELNEPGIIGLWYKSNIEQFEIIYQGKELFGELSKEQTKNLEKLIK